MKIERKHIIIAIVVAVVAYLLWKRSKSMVLTDDPTGTGAPAKSEIDSILEDAGANSSLKSYVRNFAQSVENNPKWKQDIMDKAVGNGNTYAQQVVLDAFWMKYHNEDGSWKDSTPWSVYASITSM